MSFFQRNPAAGSSASGRKPGHKVPWVEKYRPKQVDDVAHQDEITKTLKSSIATGSLPHLLFYGPAGTGKTSTILAVAREMFGSEFRSNGRVLELNASDERGIAVVREKVKTFAQGSINTSSSSRMPPFKLIILDEADSMTSDAQSALRRMIETYSKVTRFCLICNYVSRIIEPIASRCAKFRFKPLEISSMATRLETIASAEGFMLQQNVVSTILEASRGDMRKAINLLQSATQLNGKDALTPEQIEELAGTIAPEVLSKLWQAIESQSFSKLQEQVDDLMAEGYSVLTLLQQLTMKTIRNKTLSDVKKSKICLILAKADKNLLDGANEALQFLNVATSIMSIWHSAP